jgi:3-hydroxyisobutyrate dehydrogenase-like beta-hydroxyacid dehydrogenase
LNQGLDPIEQTMASPLVGFIGLGNMGLHMARNLMRNGNRLVVCDIDPKRLDEIAVRPRLC